jgi:hypothetical protein
MKRFLTLATSLFGVMAMGFGLAPGATAQKASGLLPQDGVVLFQGGLDCGWRAAVEAAYGR